jgi:hypothetical protein
MRFDAQLIKERVSIKELFEGDNHELKRMGSSYVCRCPFHEEKTASCHVHPDDGYYKCFGCGAGGDVFKYWQETRNCDFAQAIKDLAAIGGLTNGSVERNIQHPTSNIQRPKEELARRMEGEHLESWLKAIERLKESEARQVQMAEWRGYSIETVRWANEHGLLGLVPYLGEWREAFLVERPDALQMIPVGYHLRLGPTTAGNPGSKASWRYMPTGIGAWPFVLGNVWKATALFFLEGQWDGLALVDAMEWYKAFPEKIAIVGMRGATSWKRFIEHYTWSDEAVAFALLDADSAGRGWLAEDGFLNVLRDRCKRTFSFFPDGGHAKDFNDVWKDRAVSREQLSILFRDKMRHPTRGRRPRGKTFLQFCRSARKREDPVGTAAQFICKDTMYRPVGRKPLPVWERYMRSHVPQEQHAAIRTAWREWVHG